MLYQPLLFNPGDKLSVLDLRQNKTPRFSSSETFFCFAFRAPNAAQIVCERQRFPQNCEEDTK